MNLAGSQSNSEPPSRTLWLALLGAPLIWGAQELLCWWLTDYACAPSGRNMQVFGYAGLRAWTLAISIVALVCALWCVWIGWRAWHQTQAGEREPLLGKTRQQYLAGVTLLVAVSFTVGVVLTGMGPVFLNVCERWR